MHCRDCTEQLDAYLDGELSASDTEAYEAHLEACADCARRLTAEDRLRSTLRALPVPEPEAGFESRVLAAATGKRHSHSNRWSHTALATVAAMALFAGVFIGIGVENPASDSVPTPVAQAPDADYEVRTVKLAFDAQKSLDGVMLTLELPANVELAPFPGRQQVSWQVDLKAGENVLALPLRVLYPSGGEIVAHLQHGSQSTSFRTVLPASGEPSS